MWTADGWRAPQRDVESAARRGVLPPAPTSLSDVAAAPPLDVAEAERKLRRDLSRLQDQLRKAAAAEPRVGAQLRQWADKAGEYDAAMQPPEAVKACAVRPDAERFVGMPFARRCQIPTTEPMAQRWPPPRWPPSVPQPESLPDTFMPEHRNSLRRHVQEVVAYNAGKVMGCA